ncbi:hypothetical protein KY329_04325, partial [Candidatus Woesearchaeota archaeon]|nr:hypothetical protein [Candidatus Woesearchaeota archaeon]
MSHSDQLLTVASSPLYDTVGIVSQDRQVRAFSSFILKHRFSILDAETIEELEKMVTHCPQPLDGEPIPNFDRLMALIIGEDQLQHPRIHENFLTPIILRSQRPLEAILAEQADHETLLKTAQERYNIFDYVQIPATEYEEADLLGVVREAIGSKTQLVSLLKQFPQRIISRVIAPIPEPPRYLNLQPRLAHFKTAATELRDTSVLSSVFWAGLVKYLKSATKNAETKLKLRSRPLHELSASDLGKNFIDSTLALMSEKDVSQLSNIIDYLVEQHELDREGLVKIDEEVGENGMLVDEELEKYHAFRWGAFRIEKPRQSVQGKSPVPAHLIALQRFLDSYRFREDSNFQTPLITLPSSFEKNGEEYAFWVTEYIPGITLNVFIEELSGKADSTDKNYARFIRKIRYRLLDHYAKACGYFARNAGSTFIRKPTGNLLAQSYKSAIADLPDLANLVLKTEFEDKEKQLWTAILDVLDSIDYDDNNIVRNKDSSLNNCRILCPKAGKEADIETVINEITVPSSDNHGKRAFSDGDLKKSMWFVDNQYKWGHLTEDPAQIVTMYEARFLWGPQNKRQREGLLEAYLLETGITDEQQLKQAAEDFDHMCFYRVVRKFALFCQYWRAHLEKTDGEFDPERKDHILN